jgi:hypothetical protein
MMGMNFDAWWYWLIAAALMAAAELLIPGVFLVWVAIAAAITGVVTLAWDLPVALQLIVFATSAVIATLAGRKLYSASPVPSSDPLLNNRVERLVGETIELTHAIVNGRGRARVGDSEWNVRGPDAPAGTVVRVMGIDDGALAVRPLTPLPSETGSTSQP